MKTLCLITLLMQFIVQMPDKGVSAINFTLTGIDVVEISSGIPGKIVDWNKSDNKTCHIVIYGGKRKLTNEDTITIKGYQTAKEVKMIDVVGSTPDGEQVGIYNRYKMG